MMQSIGQTAFLVHDYDEALEFFTAKLGFEILEDQPLDQTKRWVVVKPAGNSGTALLLAKAANAEQASRVGNQTGGRVFLFLHTDDFWRDHGTMTEKGVKFLEEPRQEPYGIVAVFLDLYGNKWDLIQIIREST